MDAKISWKISSKVDGLIDAIVACRKQLIDSVKQRHPYNRSTKIRYCDAHVSPKVCQLLEASSLWKECAESETDFETRRVYKRPHSQEMVADCEMFKVVKDDIIGDENIRLVIEFETSKDEWEIFFGNVELVSK